MKKQSQNSARALLKKRGAKDLLHSRIRDAAKAVSSKTIAQPFSRIDSPSILLANSGENKRILKTQTNERNEASRVKKIQNASRAYPESPMKKASFRIGERLNSFNQASGSGSTGSGSSAGGRSGTTGSGAGGVGTGSGSGLTGCCTGGVTCGVLSIGAS